MNKISQNTNLLNVICNAIYFIQENKQWIKSNKKKVVLMATPAHGNLGDHAIALAEKQLLEKYINPEQILEIPYVKDNPPMWFYSFFIGKSPVFITGGGFLGSLWPNEENMVLNAVKYFRKSRIIIFPQTVYYEKNTAGSQAEEKAKNMYHKAKNVILFLRDKQGYKYARNIFGMQKIFFAPDMALRLNVPHYNYPRNGVLCCLRRDKECAFNFNNKDKMLNILKKYFTSNQIHYTDTVISRNLKPNEREKLLQQKWKEFSKYELIVTDRLHGMIFSLLTGTPCISVNNSNGKVKEVYEVIKENAFVQYVENIEEIEPSINLLLTYKNMSYDPNSIKYKYKTLENILDKLLIEK